MITNIPVGMVTDQFGMIGLLTFIRAAETEPNLVTLALGRYDIHLSKLVLTFSLFGIIFNLVLHYADFKLKLGVCE